MADCGISSVGCLKEIVESILCPPIKRHIDYWWCFDNNTQDLTDGIRDLEIKIDDINQKMGEARLRTEKIKPWVEEWSKAGTEKLGEAKRILQVDINRRLLQDDIYRWNLISRYSMGKRVKKAVEEIAKHQNDGNFNAITDPPPPPAMCYTTNRSIMDFESRKRIEEDIITSLKESSVGMIGICGMGGVGKTTMAHIIRERVMEEKLFDEVVMVVVSQHIDMLKIQKEIAECLGLKFDAESMPARAYKLRKRLMDTRRKIVIFDDVWETFKLEHLGVPFESGFEGCKILLTTQSKYVCERMEFQKIIKIEILTEEESWFLFKMKAGNCVEDSTLFPVAKHVVAKCNGLPIALVTVGMALRDEKNKLIWEYSLSQLSEANPADFPEVLKNVYYPLKLSYDYLDNEHERLLFRLCCLFPEDHDIPVEELTLYFMGLQIFDDITHIEEARNRMRRLVEKLKSCFLLIDGGKKHHVKMHDVVVDVANYIGSKEKDCVAKSLNEISIENSSDINCNWMSVDVSNEPMNVDMGLRFPNLHLLMLRNLSSDISLEGIGNLNVLSFSRIGIGSLPLTLGYLQNLRTLYLYDCEVEDISVIGELASLKILYCNHCHEIKELPAKIGRLNHLTLLELNKCYKLQRIPFCILSSLVWLEELKMHNSFKGWEAEENGKEIRNASVRELESLPNLTCLEIEISDSKLAAQEIRRLSPNLFKYYIRIGPIDYWYEESADYEKVMKLKLPSDIGPVGKWIQILVKNTECLFLEGDGSNKINVEECQDLRYLRVENCRTLKEVVKTKDCKSGIVFPMLETLYLSRLENLEEICDDTIILNQNNVSSFRNLKYLYIERCSKLRYLFSVSVATTYLLQLEELEIIGCSAMEQVFRNDITDGCIQFPKLKKLTLHNLPNLTAFCLGIENIKFPQLTKMWIGELPKLNSFCGLNSETGNLDTNSAHLLCNPKVEIGGVKTLTIWCWRLNYNYIRNIWCRQIPINFFYNLQELRINLMHGIRSLMPYSIAKNLLSLKDLRIEFCKEMIEVIECDVDDIEVVGIKFLFSTLKTLKFVHLPKLRSFGQWNHALELPRLEYVDINQCPLIETFTLGSVNTSNLKELVINDQAIDDIKDLNDVLNHHIRAENQNTSMIEEEEDEDENEDANKDEDKEDNIDRTTMKM